MTARARQTVKSFELKGEMSMLSVFRLFDTDLINISDQLAHQVSQAPVFFQNMPIIIDLQALFNRDDLPSFSVLTDLLREHGLVPVGVRNANETQYHAARRAGLALLQEQRHTDQQVPRPASSEAKPVRSTNITDHHEPQPRETRSQSRLVVRPVRSGQQVSAANGDLVVVAPVSAGSELLADGCIHVYGPLRGRALAGMNGDESARIFCQSLEAELIAIAGHYQINEELAPGLKGKPAQVWLDNQRLMISPI
ncbi:MAG: septum site-determining protein MinC [Pseudomonadota bacterium]